MAWFRREHTPLPAHETESRVPEGLYVKCGSCKESIYRNEVLKNLSVCPKCSFHFRVPARERMPLLIVSCSGGARMMEGTLSLMQMAKISAALARLDQARVPFISLLTDPTTGGVTASFAMLGDLNMAEPGALIGFAGPRVIEQTIRQKLPEGFQRAEFLLQHGMLDMVVDRRELKKMLVRSLKTLLG